MNKNQTKVKTVQFAIGVDLLGSRLTMSSNRNNELEATAIGVMLYSKTTNRYVMIPYSNCKGIEFFPPEAEEAKEPKAPKK